MSAHATPLLDAVPAYRPARNVREVIALCAKHGVPCGDLDNLSGFMQALNRNKHLAMDVWSLIARLIRNSGGTSEPDWLLGTVVEGVTGRSLAEVREAGPSDKILVERFARVLAGEDLATLDPDPTPKFPPQPVRRRAGFDAYTGSGAAAPSVALRPAAKRAKLFEPEPITNPAWLNLHLVPEAEPGLSVAADANALAQETEPRWTLPLARYQQYGDRNHAPAAYGCIFGVAALLAAAAGGGFLIAHARHAAKPSHATAATHAVSTAAANPVTPQALHPVPAMSSPAGSAVPHLPTQARASTARISKPASDTHHKQSKPAPAKPAKAVTSIPAKRRQLPPVPATQSQSKVVPQVKGPLAVPEAVMRQNLASSRVPVVPAIAKAGHISGLVVVQAVVTRDGSVGHLHVVSGDPALRRAAVDAAATWRYRPYLLGGQTVDVSTTISVDFSGSD